MIPNLRQNYNSQHALKALSTTPVENDNITANYKGGHITIAEIPTDIVHPQPQASRLFRISLARGVSANGITTALCEPDLRSDAEFPVLSTIG